jgi:broad specificity phosphatase PhoE
VAEEAGSAIRLVLVRHAPTAWSGVRYAGRSDPPLTNAGVHLAADLARDLAARHPWRGADAVRLVTSPSDRARSTAQPIATAFETSPEVDARWAEVDVGRFEGATWETLEAADPDLAARLAAGDAEVDWPDGETAAAFATRIAAALAAVLADPRPTIVVSHAGTIRLAAALATGRPARDVAFPPIAGVVEIDAAALR